jgi:hypothetical protein
MTLDLGEDFGGLQQSARVRKLPFGIGTVPANRIDLPANLEATHVRASLIGGQFIFEREADASTIGNLEAKRIMRRHQALQSAS